MSFNMIAGDLEPDMSVIVDDDISDALAYVLEWIDPDGIESELTLSAVNLATGQLRRTWEAGDTDKVGIHQGRVRVTRGNGEDQHYPSDGTRFRWYVHE